jgi:4-oxalocrotonate tautomerase
MPFVSVRIVEGHSKERKDEMARRITAAVADVAGVPKEVVWVTFEDIPADEWYIGAQSVTTLRKTPPSSGP